MKDDEIISEERISNEEVHHFVVRERRLFRIFKFLFTTTKLFKHWYLIPSGFVEHAYSFVKEFYQDTAVFYYFKDKDDVGLFECFILNDDELNRIADITKEREKRLGKDSFILHVYGHDKDKEKHEENAINVDLTTIDKKRIIAEKAVRTGTVLLYFSRRISKLNEKLYAKINWLYRTLRCSVYLRSRRYFEKESRTIRQTDVEMISRIISAEL